MDKSLLPKSASIIYISFLVLVPCAIGAHARTPDLQILLPLGGHDQTIRFPAGDFSVTAPLRLEDMQNMLVIGNGTTLRATGPSSAIFSIVGSTHVRLTGFRLIGHASATQPSTGSGPGIMVGSTNPTETRTNHDIEIDHTTISGANWAGIMIYGRYGVLGSIKNDTIKIHDNDISDSSNGIFVYKNAQAISIYSNRIDRTGQDGIAVDTRAATDRIVSEGNSYICVTDNIISNAGLSAQGIGVLVKGNNDHILIARNRIRSIGTQSGSIGPIAAGIALVPDFGKSVPSHIMVTDNTVEDVRPTSSSGYGLLADPGVRSLTLHSNTFSRIGRPASASLEDRAAASPPSRRARDFACPITAIRPPLSVYPGP
jgi:hypothetical protein